MSKKILIIDDDLTFQKTIRETLESAGYDVVEAHDGIEGLKIVEVEKPNLILLDIVMPKLGGIEFLRILQKNQGSSPYPVLITSNFSGIGKIDEGLELGIRGYIVKSNESLKTIVNSVELLVGEAGK